ncbi:MAG: CcmD family protein [Deltaproteobacteria bacterium]|jgi:CcmD family protein|nr:CcmD family protein [Deltaproteobacteria bacterium]
MSKIDWLWLGGAAVWLGFGAYLVLLARRQASLERRLAGLETSVRSGNDLPAEES